MLIPADAPTTWDRLLRLAERHPRRAARIARRIQSSQRPDPCTDVQWLDFTVGWVLLRAEQPHEALVYLHRAATGFSASGDSEMVLHCGRAVLIAEGATGGSASLQASWKHLALAYDARELHLDAARTRVQQAAHLNALFRFQDALDVLAEVSVVIVDGDHDDRARLLRVTAIAHANTSRFDDAIFELYAAAQLFQASRAPLERAKCLFEVGHLHHRLERFQEALTVLRDVLPVLQRFNVPFQIALCEKSMGLAASRLGHYGEALMMSSRARSQFHALGRLDHVAGCDLNLSTIAFYCGMYEFAHILNRHAQQVYTQLGLVQRKLVSERNEALFLRKRGQGIAALHLLQALEEPVLHLGDRLEYAELMFEQAETLYDLGQRGDALERLRLAREGFDAVGNPIAAAACLFSEGWVHLEDGEFGLAASCLQAAKTELASHPARIWRILFGLGRCAEHAGDPTTALHCYVEASDVVARLRSTVASEQASSALFVQAQQLYEHALRLAADLDDVTALLRFAEQQRALVFQRQIAGAPLEFGPELSEVFEEQRQELQRLVALAVLPDDLEDRLARYTETLLLARHHVPLPEQSLPSVDVEQLRATFDAAPGVWDALIYATNDDELFIVTLDRMSSNLYRIPFDANLRSALEQASSTPYRHFTYHDLPFRTRQTTVPWELLARLTHHLVPLSIREHLHPDHRLYILPCGPLHALPWAALRVGAGWLCEHACITVLPGLSQTMVGRHPVPEGGTLLVGCSAFGTRAEPLPTVASELDLVALHSPGSSMRLEDESATRSQIFRLGREGVLQRVRLVHIATHAQLSSRSGLLGHIKLWDDDLFYDELPNLRLGGALVVLTGCEGAASAVLPGEEILSLGRGFLAAGAGAVIASLWSVYDTAVRKLLVVFYARLAAGDDAATALARAQRVCIHDPDVSFQSPLLWGSFRVLGINV